MVEAADQEYRLMSDHENTETRQCGTCTACCEGWLSSRLLQMRPGQPCVHCTREGCAIYEDRPENPCVTFNCAWLQFPEKYPDDMRPDICGAIVRHDRSWNRWEATFAFPTGSAVPESTLERLKTYASQENIPLIFVEHVMESGKYTAVKRTGYGPPDFIEAVNSAIAPEDLLKL
jgi:hypothetical protein